MAELLPSSLGVTVLPDGVQVAVVSRHAARIDFCLFDEAGDFETLRVALETRRGDVHLGFISGIGPGARYGFRAEGPWEPAQGHRFDPKKLLADPYAFAFDRAFQHHAELQWPRDRAVDTAAFMPKGIIGAPSPSPAPRLARTGPPGFIYEVAVKAFSKLHPVIPEAQRGTVAALAHPVIIDHLTKLRVDTVQLMPLTAAIDERHLPALGLHNAWFYNPVTFMAPDPRLAPGGFAEIRDTVAALHEAGIAVILDMVLNHTGESDVEGTTLSLRGLDNALYFRHAADDPGRLINDTGCGNTMALDIAPVARLALDSLRRWAHETGIDGFRFDLATVLGRTAQGFTTDAPLLAAIEADPLLRELTMIAEPWDVGPEGYRLGQFPGRWSEWNDRYRDDIRRFWRGDRGMLGALATRLAGSSDIFRDTHRLPSASVNYLAVHDGFPLADLVAYAAKHNEANGEHNRDGTDNNFSWNNGVEGWPPDILSFCRMTGRPAGAGHDTAPNAPDPVQENVRNRRANDVKSLLATLFLSRGTVMLTAGDEFGRSQGGNNNAYAQDNAVTWLDWAGMDRERFDFTCKLAEFRRRNGALFGDRWLTGGPIDATGIPDIVWLHPDGRPMADADWAGGQALGFALYGGGERVCVWINGSSESIAITMPSARASYHWEDAPATVPARSVACCREARDTGRTAGTPDELLEKLAESAGIQPVWWDIEGHKTEVPIETKRALLTAMGIDYANASVAWDSLYAQMSRNSKRYPICGNYLTSDLKEKTKLFGLSAHLYTLKTKNDTGCGDFATLAEYCSFARSAGAYTAGINPLHHLFPTNRERMSPYQPSDRRFIDPIYIHVDGMPPAKPQKYIDYSSLWAEKDRRLRALFKNAPAESADEALTKHAIFEAIAFKYGTVDRTKWPKDLDNSKASGVAGFAAANAEEVGYRIFLQQLAMRQLAEATGEGAPIYADLALGVAEDSGEIWANPDVYAMNVSIGAPPDPFAADGQVWNLTPFRPQALVDLDFGPYRAILEPNLRHAGLLRIDHVLGFARQFWVPKGASGAQGAYVTFPL
ncbi:MAG: glycogen debranching protein GlgX, partial [Rhizobiales bacterium]|nr:glycogen debranching protein GlgX [Hyphomicrobiales bacterium]